MRAARAAGVVAAQVAAPLLHARIGTAESLIDAGAAAVALDGLRMAASSAVRRSAHGRVFAFLRHSRASFFQKQSPRCLLAEVPPGSLDLCRALLPSHLPQRPPDLFSATALSGRRRGRRSRRRTAWLIAEELWASFTFHELGGAPSESLLQQRLGDWNVSLEQSVQFHLLHAQVLRMCRLTPEVGRGAKLLSAHNLFHEDSLLSGDATNHTIERLVATSARPATSDRAVPAVAATVCPEDFLKGEKRRLFCNQQELILDKPLGPPPRRCHMVSEGEETKLRSKLLSSGAARCLPAFQVPVSEGVPLIAGFFRSASFKAV